MVTAGIADSFRQHLRLTKGDGGHHHLVTPAAPAVLDAHALLGGHACVVVAGCNAAVLLRQSCIRSSTSTAAAGRRGMLR